MSNFISGGQDYSIWLEEGVNYGGGKRPNKIIKMKNSAGVPIEYHNRVEFVEDHLLEDEKFNSDKFNELPSDIQSWLSPLVPAEDGNKLKKSKLGSKRKKSGSKRKKSGSKRKKSRSKKRKSKKN